MTKLTYQATSLRQLVKQMLPSAESKNISESKQCVLQVRELDMRLPDGSSEYVHVLYASTRQPSFMLEVGMPLTTEWIETEDPDLGIRVDTRDLDTALGSFGQQMVTLEFCDHTLRLSTYLGTDADGKREEGPVKNLTIKGETVIVDPEEDEDDIPTNCTLTTSTTLIEGLRAVVPVASERGNGTARQVVEIIGMPERITFQAQHPNADSSYTHPNPWQRALQKTTMTTLSPDSARHLVSALVGFGFHEPVEMNLTYESTAIRTRMVKMIVQ